MKKEFIFLLVASMAQIVTADEEWIDACKNQSEKIVIHSADGNWKNLSSDVISHQAHWLYRKLTCTADADDFAFVRINDKMDLPSETKTITCGQEGKWLYNDEVVVAVGCYTSPRANWIHKQKEEQKIEIWMAVNHGREEDQKDWTWGSTQSEQRAKMQRMASEIKYLLVNTDNIIREQVAVLPAAYVNAYGEKEALSEDNYYMKTGFVGFGDDNSVLKFANYVIFVFRGGLPGRSQPDAKKEFRHYFQDEFKSIERHDGIQSLAERAATYGDKWEGRVDIVTVFRKGANHKTCTYLYGASGDWMISEVKMWSHPCAAGCGDVCVAHLTA